MKIDGRKIAETLIAELKNKLAKLDKRPILAILQVGAFHESSIYISGKKRIGERIRVKVIHDCFPETVSERKIIDRVEKYNDNTAIHGIIVQLPLPSRLDTDRIISKIAPAKDVDGFLPNSPYTPPVSCAVLKVLQIGLIGRIGPIFLKQLRSKRIVVVGRGRTGGKPIIQTFNKIGVSYILIHSQTKNPAETMRTADVIISCVGKPRIVTSTNIKDRVVLISVGVHRDKDGKLHGDYEEEDIKNKATLYTPTPGGIGPLTVACLMKNVVRAANPKL